MTGDIQTKWQSFLKKYPVINCKKGQVLFFQGESPRYAYVIKKGIIKTYDISDEGYEQLIYLSSVNDIFPYPWIMNQAPTVTYYYEALTNSELFRIPKEDYRKFIAADQTVLMSELERRTARDVSLMMRVNALLHSKASDKLINILHFLVTNHGIFLGNNQAKINLDLTHQDLANLTGLRRETVATELYKLKASGLVDYRRHSLYQVDLKVMKKALNKQFVN